MYNNINSEKKCGFIGIRNVNICMCPIHTQTTQEVQV